MNSMKINLYRICTLQEFSQIDLKQTADTTEAIKRAQESDQIALLRTLIKKAAELDPSKYGHSSSVYLSSEPVLGTQNMNVDVEIKGLTDEQNLNMHSLVQHAMDFSVFYLNIENKYRCRASGFEHKTPVEYMSIIQEVTQEFLDDHFGGKLKSRNFTGVRSPNDLGPCTVKVRKLIDNQNPGTTLGLINAKGIVTNFNRSSGRLDFEDQYGEEHKIYFSANSFLSPEHELYYHDTDPSYKRQIEISFRIVESRKELLTLEIEPINSLENTDQFQAT
ncbi:hypothetical protein [Limnobacter sp.]|uniref:hypothetical protein n=1 Tax=Limnobacter sp. TaxID=2003368 RepID=UPI0039C94FC7